MADFGVLIQGILSFVAGSGLTGFLFGLYQVRVQTKLRSLEFYREMVLTPDLFHVLRIYSDALDIIEKHDLIKDENGAWIWIRGSFKKVRSMTRAEREIDRLGLEFLTALKKTKETGVWYLLPDDLREILNEIPNPAVVWNEKDNKRRRRLTHAYERQLGSFRDGVRNALDIKTL